MLCTEIHLDTGEVHKVERTPVCGVDFCDSCADCLACVEPGDLCYGHNPPQPEHAWVVYYERGQRV